MEFAKVKAFLHTETNKQNLSLKHPTGADPGFLDRGFKLAEGGSIYAV